MSFHDRAVSQFGTPVQQIGSISSETIRAVDCLPSVHWASKELWCRSVKGRCRAPGSGGMPHPFTCPLDTVLDVQSFINDDPHHGPTIDFREHNFLDQENLPAGMKVRSASFCQREYHPGHRECLGLDEFSGRSFLL